jgi:GT2 family glycosyltransferase
MRRPYVMMVIPFKGKTELNMQFLSQIRHLYVTGFTYGILFWDDGTPLDELNAFYNAIPRDIGIAKHDHQGYTKACYDIFETFKLDTRIDYLLLCNNDIKFRPGSFFALVNRMMHNANYSVVGGKILEWEGDKIIHTGTVIKDGKVFDPYVGLDCNTPEANTVQRRLWVNGCCSLYNMDILRKEDLNFSLDFCPAYFEESNLQTELNNRGYPVIYEPRAEIHHAVNQTMNSERDKYEKVFWTNWQKYLDKWESQFTTNPMFDFGDQY